MQIKKVALIFSFHFSCLSCLAQSSDLSNNSAFKIPNIQSPEVASLGKFGTYDVNLNTGSPSISIPLHSISESGINVPISISYDASGFIPNKQPGIIGQDWNLTAGGAITRIVNERADETYDFANVNPLFNVNIGYLYALRNPSTYPRRTTEEIRSIQFFNLPPLPPAYTPVNFNVPGHAVKYEYAPDMFSFNFLGHSGNFFIDNNGVVRVVSDRNYKVDLTNMKGYYDIRELFSDAGNGLQTTKENLNTKLASEITITSDDGYKFIFGGAFKNLEINFSFPRSISKGIIANNATISAWYIKKVVSPSGEEISFEYRDVTDDETAIFNGIFIGSGDVDITDYSFLTNKISSIFEVKLGFSERYDIDEGVAGAGFSFTPSKSLKKSLIKKCHLSSIKSKIQQVQFIYETNPLFYGSNPIFDEAAMSNVNLHLKFYSLHLTQMLINDKISGGNNELLTYSNFPKTKFISFGYETKVTRLYLNNVNVNGDGYVMSYNNSTTNNIDPLTLAIDRWGFYNGRHNNIYIIPKLLSTDLPPGPPEFEVNFNTPDCNRMPNGEVANIGMLNKIIYPTKGITEFEFELHDFSKRLTKTVSGGNVPVLQNVSGLAGGVRIRSIKTTPGITTTYLYKTSYPDNGGESSGILMDNDHYVLTFWADPNGDFYGYKTLFEDQSLIPSSSYSESHIAYSSVIKNQGLGYTKYKFSDVITNPDNYYDGPDSWKITADVSRPEYNFNGQLLRMFKSSSRAKERGKLILEENWKQDGNDFKIVSSNEIIYDNNNDRFQAKTMGINLPHSLLVELSHQTAGQNNIAWLGLVQSYALYYYKFNIKRTVFKKFSDNELDEPLVTTTDFKYNTDKESPGFGYLTFKEEKQPDGTVLKTTYKYPFDITNDPIYEEMVSRYIISQPISEVILKNDNLQKAMRRNFDVFGSNIKLKSEEYAFVNPVTSNWQMGIIADEYSSVGNIKQSHKANDLSVAYIWGYKDCFPIAVVQNASSESIAYTSFEEANNQVNEGWSYNAVNVLTNLNAPTGNRYYDVNNSPITSMPLNQAQHYIVSFWRKANANISLTGATINLHRYGQVINDWIFEYYEVTNASNIQLNGSGGMDELRLYPVGAVMNTYSYGALVGLINQCDANNRISYFIYDKQGRLKMIRDMDRKVLKLYCYNYYGETEECALSSEPSLQSTGTTRCQPCAANLNYYSGVLENVYIDVNPQSPTYNQYSYLPQQGSSNSCTPVPDYQPTGIERCELYYGYNTGNKEIQLRNMNPCASNAPEFIWESGGPSPTTCPPPPPCNASTCVGIDKKCINGYCITGVKIYSAIVYDHGAWNCTYHYHWQPDCSDSGNYSETLTIAPSLEIGICDF